jgi:hypothetical protein
MRGKDMKKVEKKESVREMRTEYDFNYSKAVRGKYSKKLIKEGSNVVILDADIARSFHDSTSVNEALRSLLEITDSTKRLTRHPAPRAKSAKSS